MNTALVAVIGLVAAYLAYRAGWTAAHRMRDERDSARATPEGPNLKENG